ncbi:MAG TPA: hypothetical protein VGO59_07070 [Verrucomicrobiae bacterium]|jgi:hypothetical protein
MKIQTFTIILLASVLGLSAQAESYSINWYKIADGGGTSANSQYSLTGTIGQHDASGPMTDGNYSVTGGFWSLVSVAQTPGAPVLQIAIAGRQVIVSWPSSVTGFTLQTNNNLATGVWGNFTGPAVNNTVTNSLPSGNLFFRLKQE